jgi:hypothetical protein
VRSQVDRGAVAAVRLRYGDAETHVRGTAVRSMVEVAFVVKTDPKIPEQMFDFASERSYDDFHE